MKKLILFFIILISILNTTNAQTNCSPSQVAHLDINNVDATLLNGNNLWGDLLNPGGYKVPKGVNISLFSAGALWIGGIDPGGNLHLAAGTYRQNGIDFFPGPLGINGDTISNACKNFNRMWKINKSTIDSFRNGKFSSAPSSISQWPGKGNPNLSFLPNQDLAPFVDINGDGIYNPVKGDYPNILGDQSVWWVINDKSNSHGESGGFPLGIEVQIQAFAFKTSDCLNDATFYQYKVKYKGVSQLDSTYIAFWSDPDLGCAFNDLIGCDSSRDMSIVYKDSSTIGGCINTYGNQPPFFGIDFLGGTNMPGGKPFKMSKFGYYNNDFTVKGNPESAQDYYSYMTGTWKDDSHWTKGGNAYGGSTIANYVFPDAPNNSAGWSECSENNPASQDKRIIMSNGPRTLMSGDEFTFYIGVVWSRPPVGTYPCPSFSFLQSVDDCVQDFFDKHIITTEINEVATKNSVNIFPNPSSSSVTITKLPLNSSEIEIIDILGRTVIERKLNFNSSSVTVDISELPSGIYFALIKSKEQTVTGKLVKE